MRISGVSIPSDITELVKCARGFLLLSLSLVKRPPTPRPLASGLYDNNDEAAQATQRRSCIRSPITLSILLSRATALALKSHGASDPATLGPACRVIAAALDEAQNGEKSLVVASLLEALDACRVVSEAIPPAQSATKRQRNSCRRLC